MKLYDFAFSPNCRKVRAVAYELGVAFDYQPVSLPKRENRGPAFLAINPNGRVPVLEDDGFVLWESTAILRYLATGTALLPAAKRAVADVDRWLSWQVAHLAPAMSKVAFERVVKRILQLGPADEAVVTTATADYAMATSILDGALANRDYVAGALSIADFALAAHYTLAEACGLEVKGAAVQSWLARMTARDSMQRALADARMVM